MLVDIQFVTRNTDLGTTSEIKSGVARITMLDGDRGNTLTIERAVQLLAAVQAARRAGVRVVVLGATGRTFCVGGDLRAFNGADDRSAYVDDLAEVLHRLVNEITGLDAIVVSVVQGVAAGAGLPIALAADIVLAHPAAKFTLAYTNAGLTPDGGSSYLPVTVGLHRALYMALLNPVLSAEEAHSIGLVAEVCDDLEARLQQVVDRLMAGSGPALAATKRLLREEAVPRAATAMRKEAVAVRTAAGSPDAEEGIRAFLQKRAPIFPSAQQMT